MQCISVQFIAVQCISVKCIAVQCICVKYISVQCIYLSLIVPRSISYQVAMPSLWNGQSAYYDIEYYRARDDTRLDTLSDDGMPCEMDNQAGP